jgi:hypothetical protein
MKFAKALISSSFFVLVIAGDGWAYPTAKSPVLPISTTEAQKVEILKREIDTMKHYHDSLLATVYWSLAGVLGLAFVLIGSSWYTNYKIHESEKAQLREEVDKKIAQAKSIVDACLLELSESTQSRIDAQINELSGRMERRIDAVADNTRISHDKLDRRIQEIYEAFEISLKFPPQIRKKVAALEALAHLQSEKISFMSGKPLEALVAQYMVLLSSVEAREDDEAHRAIHRMKDNLEEHILPSGIRLPSNIIGHLQEALSALLRDERKEDDGGVVDATLAAQIIELINKIPATEPWVRKG